MRHDLEGDARAVVDEGRVDRKEFDTHGVGMCLVHFGCVCAVPRLGNPERRRRSHQRENHADQSHRRRLAGVASRDHRSHGRNAVSTDVRRPPSLFADPLPAAVDQQPKVVDPMLLATVRPGGLIASKFPELAKQKRAAAGVS